MATSTADFVPLTGHCTCKTLTYKLLAPPLITHCCHCSWCQRETGSAFVLNAMIESSNFVQTSPFPDSHMLITTPSSSGKGQTIARCSTCFVAIYSHYAGSGAAMTFVRVGTLSDEDGSKQRVSPDVHIFTKSKMGWVDLSGEVERGVKVCEEYYDREEVWGKEALERRKVWLEKYEREKANESS
ncbi:Mss4-like protein [Clohesyomyces aquaticus]|uniref:Mss4-like protein n=1 Tax=Clohesyomyces aquaticus TaxID=1231657 RepID=A0A1Y2AB42_9PLEO|nr:Mss4-like protein [Clohesyomyces aquaticus]